MNTLMAEIRALGRFPRRDSALGDERALAERLRSAKRNSLLSESQLAELAEMAAAESREREVRAAGRMDSLMAEIRALGHIPRDTPGADCALAQRLAYARRQRLLSESQLAELAEIARSTIEPLRKRPRVQDD